MRDYLSLNEILNIAQTKCCCCFKQVPQDRNIFQGRRDNWDTVTLLIKKTRINTQGFYYVDITLEQTKIFDMTDESFLMFNMEGRVLLTVRWRNLKNNLDIQYMENNFNNEKIWKIYIYNEYIKVGNDPQKIPVKFEYL